MEEELEQEESF